jgi:hypothetical protein
MSAKQIKVPKRKARKMYACAADFKAHKGTSFKPFECTEVPSNFGHTMPVFVLPATPEAVEGMREAVAKAIAKAQHDNTRYFSNEMAAEAALSVLGLSHPSKKRTKGEGSTL